MTLAATKEVKEVEVTMRDDLPGNDPRTIWQNLPAEPSKMTLEKIRQKARELHARTRRELLSGIIIAALVVTVSGYCIAWAKDPVVRVLFAFAIAWAFAGQYFVQRGMWSATLPGDAASSTGLEFYRQEVERRRHLFRRVLQWSFGPVILSIGAWILAIVMIGLRNNLNPSVKMIPFFTMLAIWIVSVILLRLRARGQLRREIDELNDLERTNKKACV
jgi:hypothetical protein